MPPAPRSAASRYATAIGLTYLGCACLRWRGESLFSDEEKPIKFNRRFAQSSDTMVRLAVQDNDSQAHEVNYVDSVTLKLLYGGSFVRNELGLVYNGRVSRTAAVDVDEFCWFTIVEEAEKCGCYKRDVDAIFFMNPDVVLRKEEGEGEEEEVVLGKEEQDKEYLRE
ncbi:hypothetical protein KSS87_005555 [Heliosperma pusillum]|nr:hypothetical protein KSS87_005555 [Heliosperma pusillum]